MPRYTSYPTAPHFSTNVDAARYKAWLGALDPAAELSLYLHVPFCHQMCWYCGCNMRVVARYDPVADYTQTLIREIGLAAAALPGRMRVRHIHWGGGTPTALAAGDMLRDSTRRCASISISWMAPRTRWNSIRAPSRPEFAEALGRMGCTRASLGVQELDEKVQAAINRIQPLEQGRGGAEPPPCGTASRRSTST